MDDSKKYVKTTKLIFFTELFLFRAIQLYYIGIKASPLCTPSKENEIMDKHHLMLCPLTKLILSNR